jgi:hypothetical protein
MATQALSRLSEKMPTVFGDFLNPGTSGLTTAGYGAAHLISRQ